MPHPIDQQRTQQWNHFLFQPPDRPTRPKWTKTNIGQSLCTWHDHFSCACCDSRFSSVCVCCNLPPRGRQQPGMQLLSWHPLRSWWSMTEKSHAAAATAGVIDLRQGDRPGEESFRLRVCKMKKNTLHTDRDVQSGNTGNGSRRGRIKRGPEDDLQPAAPVKQHATVQTAAQAHSRRAKYRLHYMYLMYSGSCSSLYLALSAPHRSLASACIIQQLNKWLRLWLGPPLKQQRCYVLQSWWSHDAGHEALTKSFNRKYYSGTASNANCLVVLHEVKTKEKKKNDLGVHFWKCNSVAGSFLLPTFTCSSTAWKAAARFAASTPLIPHAEDDDRAKDK